MPIIASATDYAANVDQHAAFQTCNPSFCSSAPCSFAVPVHCLFPLVPHIDGRVGAPKGSLGQPSPYHSGLAVFVLMAMMLSALLTAAVVVWEC